MPAIFIFEGVILLLHVCLRHALRMMIFIAATAGNTAIAGALPKDFAIQTIPNRSENGLNTERILCAFGDMKQTMAKVAAEGVNVPDVADLCQAVMAETIKRGKQATLYGRMQPDDPAGEFRQVAHAATANQSQYVNVEGIRKELNCTLAYDAGRVYESFQPNALALPNWSDDQVKDVRTRCFELSDDVSVVDGLRAGALDQRRTVQLTN
ncbi:hypothetical protein K1718_27405 (plasmid) [Roseibium porphyridii]|uniref:Uncharacterized protein n=1 Tax=Roseibium porphyridii TaxID=2866279 RepID=A0ABY8FBE4_9HYPH|nr:hypothetical protein [Roseibium sp. KMA01]WFE92656.1 hypothetical protein K1718_27405 [Roseibium sp. KMA01]